MRDPETVENARRALGGQLAAYRHASGLSQAATASLLYCSRSTVANVETGRQHVTADFWARADAALHAEGALMAASNDVDATARRARELAARQLPAPVCGAPGSGARPGHEDRPPGAADDIPGLLAWVTGNNTTDEAVEQLARGTAYLAQAHTRMPARKVLAEVRQLHEQVQHRLRSGKQRLRQTRELLRIDSGLLAHACLLLGDLGQDCTAAGYGAAALVYAREAGADEAIAWSVQAKTARWRARYVESAELARRGFELSTPSPARVELAYREANAIALFGDRDRARRALRLAEEAAGALPASESAVSVWSFPPERRAVFALSVAIHAGDPDAALRAAAVADAGWASGDPKIPATWAQVRADAGIAYLMKGALDATAEQVTAIFSLPPELRIATVTGYLKNLDRLLAQRRYAKTTLSAELRVQIRQFNSAGLPARAAEGV